MRSEQQTILTQIARPKTTQRDIAFDYAVCIQALAVERRFPDLYPEGEMDFEAINTAILGRWKPSGLKRIKTEAWKLVEKTQGHREEAT